MNPRAFLRPHSDEKGAAGEESPAAFFASYFPGSMDATLEITVPEAAAVRCEEHVLLLDCRQPQEYGIARIEGARLIPMADIPLRLAELEPWRDKPIIVHCHHGVRSLRVARFLREKGFSQACSMRGGIEAWSVEIDPNVSRY